MTLPPLPQRYLLPVEAAQALDTLYGVVRREQDKNNAATLEAIEQTRSITGVRPLNREPRAGDPAAIYRVVRPSGIVDVDWDGNAPTAETPAAVTINQLGRVAVDATYHEVEDGADVKTLFAAWDATRNGATLVVPPRITLYHRDGTVPLVFRDKKHVTVRGNGLTIEATAETGNGLLCGGLTLALIEDCEFYDIKYDGRLDLRMPVTRSSPDTGLREFTDGPGAPMNGGAWTIAQYTKNLILEGCSGVRSMVDGMTLGGLPIEFPDMPSILGPNMGHTRPTNIIVRRWRSEYNLRQGISGCGFNGLTIEDAKYLHTGKVLLDRARYPEMRYDTKITLPGAGIDMEAYWDEGGYYNEGLVMRRIEVAHNWGNGLMSEAATLGAEYEDFYIHDNGGPGLLEHGGGTSKNTYRRMKIENNCASPDHKPGGKWFGSEESYEIAFADDFRLEQATIRTRRGVAAIKGGGARPVLENVTAYAAADATNQEQNGNIRVEGEAPTLRNVKSINGQGRPDWSPLDRAAIYVAKAPLQIVDCRAENTLADTKNTRGILARVRGKMARGNTASGYAVPVDINSPGEVITLGEAKPRMMRYGGPELLPGVTLGDSPHEVLVSGPDRLLVRLKQRLGWTRGAETAFAFLAIENMPLGLDYRIVGIQAATNYGREPAPAVIHTSESWQALVTIPAGSGEYYVDVTMDVEVFRNP